MLAVTVAQGTEFVDMFKSSGSIGFESKKQFIVMFDRQLINQISSRREGFGGIENESEVLTLDLWEILMSSSAFEKIGDRKSFRYKFYF